MGQFRVFPGRSLTVADFGLMVIPGLQEVRVSALQIGSLPCGHCLPNFFCAHSLTEEHGRALLRRLARS
jgi:hypothetical protein